MSYSFSCNHTSGWKLRIPCVWQWNIFIVLHTWNLKLQFKTLFYFFVFLYSAPRTSLVEHFSHERFKNLNSVLHISIAFHLLFLVQFRFVMPYVITAAHFLHSKLLPYMGIFHCSFLWYLRQKLMRSSIANLQIHYAHVQDVCCGFITCLDCVFFTWGSLQSVFCL